MTKSADSLTSSGVPRCDRGRIGDSSNPKCEARNTKQIRNSNDQKSQIQEIGEWGRLAEFDSLQNLELDFICSGGKE